MEHLERFEPVNLKLLNLELLNDRKGFNGWNELKRWNVWNGCSGY